MVDGRGGAASSASGSGGSSPTGRARAPTAICGSDDETRLVLRGILLLHRYPVTSEARAPAELGRPPTEARVVVYDARGTPAEWLDAVRSLVRENPTVLVLALLPVGGEGFRAEAERAGAHATLVKPFLMRDLLEAIDALVAAPGSL